MAVRANKDDVKVQIVGDDAPLVASLKRANAHIDASTKQWEKDFGRIEKMAGRVTAGIGAVAVAGSYLAARSIREAASAEGVWKRLEVQIDNLGLSFTQVRPQIDATAKSIQKLTRFGDEDVAEALTILVRGTRDYGEANRWLMTTLDLAIAKQISVSDSASIVAKAYNGSAKALRDMGIAAKDGKTALTDLQSVVGGQAVRDGQTLAAQLERIAGATDNLFEAIGNTIQGDNARKNIGGIADAIQALADTIEKNKSEIHGFFHYMGIGLKAASGPVRAIPSALISSVKGWGMIGSGLGGSIKAGFSLDDMSFAQQVNTASPFVLDPLASSAPAGIFHAPRKRTTPPKTAAELAAEAAAAAAEAARQKRMAPHSTKFSPLVAGSFAPMLSAEQLRDATAFASQLDGERLVGGFGRTAARRMSATPTAWELWTSGRAPTLEWAEQMVARSRPGTRIQWGALNAGRVTSRGARTFTQAGGMSGFLDRAGGTDALLSAGFGAFSSIASGGNPGQALLGGVGALGAAAGGPVGSPGTELEFAL